MGYWCIHKVTMAGTLSTVRDSFFRGDYQAAVASSIDHQKRSWHIQDFGYVVGSLCFLGRSAEAETLYQANRGRLSAEIQIQVRFFLGLGYARVSNYPKARHYFATNRRMLRHRVSLVSRFYVFQGISFFRYFCGKWRFALRDAESSYEAALRAQFLYGRVLSADLRGHLLVQMGQVHLGLRTLREAQALSMQIGNRGIARAIDIARVTYEAQFGIGGIKTIARLQKHQRAARDIQDTYSNSGLLLELARQSYLQGAFDEATALLDQAAQLIYSHQNRRQECTLNLRYAYLAYLRNEIPRGLSFLQSAKRALDPAVDHALKLSALGLEKRLVGALGLSDRSAALGFEIKSASAIYGGWINKKTLNREGRLMVEESYEFSQNDAQMKNVDPLGYLRDAIEHDLKSFGDVTATSGAQTAFDLVLQSGYLGLLLELRPALRGRSCLCLVADGNLLMSDVRGVHLASGLTPLARGVLTRLFGSPASKSDLIKAVWGYGNYHPLQHDPVVYQVITGLRKLLGPFAPWLETTESGYRINPQVSCAIGFGRGDRSGEESLPMATPLPAVSTGDADFSHKFGLNMRQAKFMRELKIGEFKSVHDYKDRFDVSELTACRDLSNLIRAGLVVRVGRARATRYTTR